MVSRAKVPPRYNAWNRGCETTEIVFETNQRGVERHCRELMAEHALQRLDGGARVHCQTHDRAFQVMRRHAVNTGIVQGGEPPGISDQSGIGSREVASGAYPKTERALHHGPEHFRRSKKESLNP